MKKISKALYCIVYNRPLNTMPTLRKNRKNHRKPKIREKGGKILKNSILLTTGGKIKKAQNH